MLTGGHIATSYLLVETAKSIGIPLTNSEIVSSVIAGNISDFDFLYGFINGKTGEAHHQNITHTPFGVLLLWLGIILLFQLATDFSTLLLFSLFFHLILDDVGLLGISSWVI